MTHNIERMPYSLADLKIGEKGIITKVKGIGAFRKRILEMGFVVGREITAVRMAPMMDPVDYKIMDYQVSLRNSEAELIEILPEHSLIELRHDNYHGTFTTDDLVVTASQKSKVINIALVGNPNCGKTTIFNFASGSKERVGNYSGVTVDAKSAKMNLSGYRFNIIDLPGTYSISTYSPEEQFVRDHIIAESPDIIVNVIDASNLERNLYLTTQLIDMDIKVVVALNMYDELESNGNKFDHYKLGKMLGIPFMPTVGSKGKGIDELFNKIIDVYENKDTTVRHIHINYGLTIEEAIKDIQIELKKSSSGYFNKRISPRYAAIKLLENEESIKNEIREVTNSKKILEIAAKHRKQIEKDFSSDTESVIADQKYGFIQGALKETFTQGIGRKFDLNNIIDNVVTNKYLGIPIFLFFMWLTFFVTFQLGQYPMDGIDSIVSWISTSLSAILPLGFFRDFIIDGILGGVGGVIVFLPNIVILYMFISLMEDTGYMARAVFIMDKAMHKIGLHGKSFIPLLMGFGCNVPAIMSTRIIESRRERMISILINPFMSCSARLTVYVLLISAFFVEYQSVVLFTLYLTGVSIAIITAFLLRKTMFKTIDLPFVMELPPYRFPTIRTITRHMWYRASQYLKKVGGVILLASIIIWALGYFPRNQEIINHYDQKIQKLESTISKSITKNQLINKEAKLHELNIEKTTKLHESSYIGIIGKTIEPLMRPIGFDWKMSVALLTGISAKEVVVGTMGVLYQADPSRGDASLVTKIQEQKHTSGPKNGQRVFSPLVAFSFMIFILIYFPCVGVISAIKKESGGWKWALFIMGYTTGLAWVMAFLVNVIGSLFI